MSLKEFPVQYKYERNILKILSKRPTNFHGALSAFPRRVLSLFVHAYQSWLFNRYLSERIKLYDSWQYPIPGDLIQTNESIEYVTDSNIEFFQPLIKKRKALSDKAICIILLLLTKFHNPVEYGMYKLQE